MKKALIILYGLPRTFKKTSEALFNKIIEPNMTNYNIDIIINTDFSGKGLTSGRYDTHNTGFSSYNYNSVDNLINDLTEYYNKYKQLKYIQFYNFTLDVCNPWFLVFKRLEMVLTALHEVNQYYDIYMYIRMDIIISNIIYFNEFTNDLLFITGSFTRPSYLHNRDLLDCGIGNIVPFFKFVKAFINIAVKYTSHIEDHKDFFLNKQICNIHINDINLDEYTNLELEDTVANRIGLVNQPVDLIDNYLFKGKTDILQYYNIDKYIFYKQILYIFKNIILENNIILGEQKNITYDIIR